MWEDSRLSLQGLLAPVLSKLPHFAVGKEKEILQEIPTETLYLALKESDAQNALWFFQNASPEQVQGLIDLDCWQGDQFIQQRFDTFFRIMTALHPVKLGEYMKWLDPEIIVRGLIGYCEVTDFDPQNPPEVNEDNLLITLDQKYALILKNTDPAIREALYLWVNKCSAFDLSMVHRHLEACKWEQLSDLEEFAYQMKKGRLEELGFVEREEAISLYARGQASLLKKELLDNPLPPNAKKEAALVDPSLEDAINSASLNEQLLPEMITEPFLGEGFFAEAFKKITSAKLAELIIQESVRSINMSLVADDLLLAPLEDIKTASRRAKGYLNLGLTYLCDANIEEASKALENYPLTKIHRLGWLLLQDLTKAQQEIRKTCPDNYFPETDENILNSLKGRHPDLSVDLLQELEIKEDSLKSIAAIYKVGAHLLHLSQLNSYLCDKIANLLYFIEYSAEYGPPLFSRLFTNLFRLSSGANPKPGPLDTTEWKKLVPQFEAKTLDKTLSDILERSPVECRPLLKKRLNAFQSLLVQGIESSKKGLSPDPIFFTCVDWKKEEISA